MLDFTSSLYLGMRHPRALLRPWSQFTMGKPPALAEDGATRTVAATLAKLQGCDRASLLPSTLHLFIDLFEVLRHKGISLYVDAAVYPIVRWGAERAAARGVPLREIAHYDVASTRRLVKKDAAMGVRPVIVADGFCPSCGRLAPLRQYLQCVIPNDGYVVLDDTQALGIWGETPSPRNPYGVGGGGSLRLHATRSQRVILGSSLAKGFGVPVAVLGGSTRLIRHFERLSETRVHSSPPSVATVHAAEQALLTNGESGDALRRHLAQLVRHFRRQIRRVGIRSIDSRFPVQTIVVNGQRDPVRLQRILRAAGVRAVLLGGRDVPEPKVAFILNALHSTDDIDCATGILADAWNILRHH